MNLEQMGFCDFFQQQITQNNLVARVVRAYQDHYILQNAQGSIRCELSGSLRFVSLAAEALPVVGDWCVLGPSYIGMNGEDCALIESVLERKSKISRISSDKEQIEKVFAANIDYCFIVSSMNKEYNRNRIERFITLAKQGNAEPILLISKSDLEKCSLELPKNIPVHYVSALSGEGIHELESLLSPGKTAVFVGASGVGKSTLMNLLLGQEKFATQEIREFDAKGRHTTTSSSLEFLANGSMIIDTAGIKTLQLMGDESNLEESFPEIQNLLGKCKFSNCQHQGEPGCVIQAALASGDLSERAYENYCKLQKEIQFLAGRKDKAHQANLKKDRKRFSRMVRRIQKKADR